MKRADIRHQKPEGRGKKSEICGLTFEVSKSLSPQVFNSVFYMVVIKPGIYHRRARHVIKYPVFITWEKVI